jgi:hypothetical protein
MRSATSLATRAPSRRAFVERRRDARALGALRSANALSLTGNEGYEITLLMLTSAAYGQVLDVAWVGVVLTVPAIVVSPLVGAWLDQARSLRGSSMRWADVIRAVLATTFAVLLIHPPGDALPLYVAACAITVFDVVFTTALRASVPLLVQGDEAESKRRLTAVNSMLVSQSTMAQLVAPPVFVLALRYISPASVVLLNAATFLVSYLLLRKFATAVTARSFRTEAVAEHKSGYVEMVLRGFAVVRGDDVALRLLIAYAVTGGIGFALLLSVPQLVEAQHLSSLTVGVSFSALAGASLLGARLARSDRFSARPILVIICDPLVRAGVVVILALAASVVTVIAGFFVIGVCAGLANVSRITVFQMRFDDGVMARVMSFYFLANQVFTPVTPFFWAAVALAFGVTTSYLVVAAIFVGASVVLIASRSIRRQLNWS